MKRLIATMLVALGLAAAGAVYFMARGTAAEPAVTTAPVSRGDVRQTVEATGTLEAVATVQVGSQVSGRIAELRADFNSVVKKGQVIARLEPSLFQAQVEQARATLARAEAQARRARVERTDAERKLTRAKELSAAQLIPESDLETAQATYDAAVASVATSDADVVQARASLNQAQVNLEHTVIEAPIDGIVISRSVDVGQTVAASMQAPVLFQIAGDLSKMQVNASIDEADVGVIRPDQPVDFTVDAYPDRTFAGTVAQVRLQPTVVQNVTTYTAVISVANDELLLKPGMTATVTIEVARRDDVLRVPNAAVRFTPTAEVFGALNQPLPAAAEATRQPRNGTRATTRTNADQRGAGASAGAVGPGRTADRGGSGAHAGGRSGNGRVWRFEHGRLVPVVVKVGLSDGAFTEVTGGPLTEGEPVVTGVSTAQSASSTTARSPLLPQFRRGGSTGGRR